MSSLVKEEVLLTSNDNTITLTTHRIFQKTPQANKEILLKDYVSHEVIRKSSSYYVALVILFGGITAFLFYSYYEKDPLFNTTTKTQTYLFLGIPALLTLLSLIFLFTSKQKILRISGKFNKIEFSIKDLSAASLNKFLNRLTVESDNRKKEERE